MMFNSSDIDRIHGDIHDRPCKKKYNTCRSLKHEIACDILASEENNMVGSN